MAKVKKTEWQFARNRYIPSVLPIASYWSWSIQKLISFDTNIQIVSIWDHGDYQAVWTIDQSNAIGKFALNYFKKNNERIRDIRKEGIISGQKVVSHCKIFSQKVAETKIEDFIEFLEKLDKLYNKFTEKSMLLWLFTAEIIHSKIRDMLRSYSQEYQEKIFRIMTCPKIESYSQKEEKEFAELVILAHKKGIDNRDVKKKLLFFQKNIFGLLGSMWGQIFGM